MISVMRLSFLQLSNSKDSVRCSSVSSKDSVTYSNTIFTKHSENHPNPDRHQVYEEPSNEICLVASVFQAGSRRRWSEPSRSWSSPGRGRCRWGRGQRPIWRLLGNETNAPPSDSRWPSALSALRWEGHAKLTETATSVFLCYIQILTQSRLSRQQVLQ